MTNSTPTTPHAIQPASDDEVWTQGEVDRLCALVERWFCIAMLVLGAVLFAGLAYYVNPWFGFVAAGSLGWAGVVVRP